MGLAEGYPGVEEVHTLNGLAINDLTVEPRIRLTRITGLHSLPDADDVRANRTARDGEIALPGGLRGKTIVYEGIVQARSLVGMRQKARALRAAARVRSSEQRMWLGPDFFMDGRIIAFDADDEQTTGPTSVRPWQRPFTLSMRLSDPRVYFNPGEAGGAAAGASTTLHNSGDVPTDPVLTLSNVGPLVTVYNGTLDKSLRFAVPVANQGGTMIVDFKQRSARIGAFDAMTGFDAGFSDWWDEYVPGLEPGDNNVGITGADMAASWYAAF